MACASFSSSFNSYFCVRRIRSPPFVHLRGRRLPKELLIEMAKFAYYDFLEKSCTTNSHLLGLFRPILQQKRKKLCSLYFDDVHSLSLWLKSWTVRFDSLRKFVVLRSSLDCKWCEEAVNAKPDIWTVNRARVSSRGLISDMRKLRALLEQFARILNKITEGQLQNNNNASAVPCDWLRLFRLGHASSDRLRAQRSLLIAKALATPKTVLENWLEKDLPKLKGLVKGLAELLREQFKAESITCQSHYTGYISFLIKCNNHLKLLIASLKGPTV